MDEPPSVREAAAAVGFRSSQTAYHHLKRSLRCRGGGRLDLLRDDEEVTVKRLYTQGNRVRRRAEDVRTKGRVVLRGAPARGEGLEVGPLQGLVSGALSYLMFAGIGGFVGYYFAKKRTEHEVGYLRRVEVVERIQLLVVSLA